MKITWKDIALMIMVAMSAYSGSFAENQGGSTGSSQTDQTLPFKLDEVKYLHHAGVKDWPVTSRLEVLVNANHIQLNFDKTNDWKTSTIRHNSGTKNIDVNANPWIFVNVNGTWHAATFEWMVPGGTTKGRYSVNGDHIKQPPLADWSPKAGETYYFMVSGLARSGPEGSQERTNIVPVQWPDGGGSSSGGTGGGSGDQGGSTSMVVTCKSGKFLGLFKKQKICGGELFSTLTSFELVEQIGDKFPCIKGETFGVHNGHALWVKGCKGRFKLTGVPKEQSSQGSKFDKITNQQPDNVPENENGYLAGSGEASSKGGQVQGEKSDSKSTINSGAVPSLGAGSKRIKFQFEQTSLGCPRECNFVFDAITLKIETDKGAFEREGHRFRVRKDHNPPLTPQFQWDLSEIPSKANIKKATLWLQFDTHEGLAGGDWTSVLEIYGFFNGVRSSIRTLRAKEEIKEKGYGKPTLNPLMPVNVTEYVRKIHWW